MVGGDWIDKASAHRDSLQGTRPWRHRHEQQLQIAANKRPKLKRCFCRNSDRITGPYRVHPSRLTVPSAPNLAAAVKHVPEFLNRPMPDRRRRLSRRQHAMGETTVVTGYQQPNLRTVWR